MASRSQTSTRSSTPRSPRGGRSTFPRDTRSAARKAPARSKAKRASSRRATVQVSSRYKGFEGEVTPEQVDELLLQALETELGGVQVYETALRCAQDEDLKEEWTKYLEQTRNHERILTDVFQERGLDLTQESPGRGIVRAFGGSLVELMETALASASREAAQLVAAECVVLAETKDHANWELIGEVAKAMGDEGTYLKEAHDEVEDEEDEHLYHTMGWTRELWLQSLGLPAILPPPEEKRNVKTAIGAAKAKAGRKKMLKTTAAWS
jgi:rubrerythrin